MKHCLSCLIYYFKALECFITGNRISFPFRIGFALVAHFQSKGNTEPPGGFTAGKLFLLSAKILRFFCVISSYYPPTGREMVEKGKGK